MSRNKKSRKPGSTGSEELIVTRNRSESDVEGRLRKRANKRKGLKSGSRHSDGSDERHSGNRGQSKDPRHGSKKLIPLVVEAKAKPNKQQRKLNAQQELEAIQNDPQLNVLIDRLENGEKLGAGLQTFVDQKLDRLEILMKQLGIYDDEEDEIESEPNFEPEFKQESSPKKSKKPASDEDLLSQFEDLDLNDFK
ncbi:Der GTPase-activating protein YihI [Vibrio rumoiensis]|uniref:Der GTPase-activating protein YihI n=1 Tax=Vibrio rumoiensis 1S-45 TaxID=1188252 RepID=A0A1E5E5X0_9VIBR|nr:Der GTPase-activating protein YihI [Vibrio rumoiensis]OEF29425.1 GTPase-activating protein [Vibrio rumoiensis 1S-45]